MSSNNTIESLEEMDLETVLSKPFIVYNGKIYLTPSYPGPVYNDFCKFEECLLRRYYKDKVIDQTPYLYRLTITDVKLWNEYINHLGFKFCEDFFKSDYQNYFNSVINIIELIHKTKIRNKIQKHPETQILDYLIKYLETNFKVKFGDENNESIESISFHTPYGYEIIMNDTGCYNQKDEYIKIFFKHSKNNDYTIATKFCYNGNLRILVFFKNEDIINPEFSYDLEEVKLDSDPDHN